MIYTIFGGFCMALADSVPGVSGGTIAFILGFYDNFIGSLHTLFHGNLAEKKTAIMFLLKIGAGWIVGFLMAVSLLADLFTTGIYEISSLFLGFVIAAIPLVISEEKDAIKGKYSCLVFSVIGAAVLVLLTIIVMMNLKKSKYGRAIMAIRDNRIAAESTGINVTYFKLAVFIIAAFFAGAAGVVYGHSFANVKAASFDYNMSIEILVIVVLGGMGSVRGSIIAAIVLQVLPELLRDFSDYRMLLYSIVLIVIMLMSASPKFAEFKSRLSLMKLFHAGRQKKEEQEVTSHE